MLLTKIIQRNYTLSSHNYQLKIPFELETTIPDDDPVRLLSAFVEELNLSDLYETYKKIKNNKVTPRQMFKIVIYAAMNRIYSCRDIQKACTRDINFMYLLEGNLRLIMLLLPGLSPFIFPNVPKRPLLQSHRSFMNSERSPVFISLLMELK